MDEAERIIRIIAGETHLFSGIIEQYQGMVYGICLRFVTEQTCAEDLTQEVFILVFQNLEKFSFKSKFSTWIYQIATNKCLTHLRDNKNKRSRQMLINDLSKGDEINNIKHSENPENSLISREQLSQIHAVLNALPENQRTAFVLKKYEELPQKEIAEIMNITEGAVEQLVMRAKSNLIKKLSPFFKKNNA